MNRTFFKSKYFNLLLFIITLVTTTITGAEFMTGRSIIFGQLTFSEVLSGLHYALPFLLILTAHEFGHYFMAIYHKIKTSLPYYIPIYFFGIIFTLGTMGAVIRIKEQITSRKIFFDIGIAGPLAGFVVAIAVLWFGFTHLPPKESIFLIHPEYKEFGLDYEKHVYKRSFFERQLRNDSTMGTTDESILPKKGQPIEIGFTTGDNLIFNFFKTHVASDPTLVPNPYEILHYPYLLVGFLALFFTALNLIPIGQLDGGHILYGLIGSKNHKIVSAILLIGLVLYGGIGVISLKTIFGDISGSGILQIPFYIAFLYFVFSKITPELKNNLLIAVSVFTTQFLIAYLFPEIKGNIFWLVYGFILSRFLGIYHPETLYDAPLDLKRKILGWISLVIFIISFSPEPFLILEIK